MRARVLQTCVAAVGCVMLTGLSASDELNWAERMFGQLKHDFGVVARGADAVHRIPITNPYKETVRIVEVKTTCGCTAAEPDVKRLETGETAYITVEMDTRKFLRRKDSNVDVTLTFNGTNYKTVRIPITAYIRSDVVLEPGKVDFGDVVAGQAAKRQVEVKYAGRSDWRIKEVETGSEYIDAQVVETERAGAAGSARVSYKLLVELEPGAPMGQLRDQLVLVTNDTGNPRVPVLVEGEVSPDITVTPPVVPFGTLTPGKEKTVSVILRGRSPFTIETIECDSDRECFKVRLPKEAKSVHVLPLTIQTPNEPGPLNERFHVSITGRDEPITFEATGQITAAE